jgi:hypothetical protein
MGHVYLGPDDSYRTTQVETFCKIYKTPTKPKKFKLDKINIMNILVKLLTT